MERYIQASKITHPEVDASQELTTAKAIKLFFLSFRLSQGDGDLQDMIFKYLHFLHPEWSMPEEFREQLKIESASPFKKYLSGSNGTKVLHVSREPSAIDATIDNELSSMQVNLNRKNKRKPSVYSIANEIMEKDFEYLCNRNGRERNSSITYNPAQDPFLSHICFFALEGHSTGAEEYDQMFREVKVVVLRLSKGHKVASRFMSVERLKAVINKYAQTHPQSIPLLQSQEALLAWVA